MALYSTYINRSLNGSYRSVLKVQFQVCFPFCVGTYTRLTRLTLTNLKIQFCWDVTMCYQECTSNYAEGTEILWSIRNYTPDRLEHPKEMNLLWHHCQNLKPCTIKCGLTTKDLPVCDQKPFCKMAWRHGDMCLTAIQYLTLTMQCKKKKQCKVVFVKLNAAKKTEGLRYSYTNTWLHWHIQAQNSWHPEWTLLLSLFHFHTANPQDLKRWLP